MKNHAIDFHKKQAYVYDIAHRCNGGITKLKLWFQWKWHAYRLWFVHGKTQIDLVLLTAASILFFVFCVGSSEARADDVVGVWLTTGEWSRHQENTNCPWKGSPCHDRYRQNNTGIGIQIDLNRDQSVVAGYYHNSIYRETVYAGMTYTPFHLGDAHFGVIGAMATGYYQYLPAVPIGGVYATYEVNGVGIGVMWLPTVVVAINLKVKIF